MRCRYAEDYGGGRIRGRACHREADYYLLPKPTDWSLGVHLCTLHARAVAGRFPELGGLERFTRLPLHK